MTKIILLLILSIVSAILYRAGGMGKEDEAKPKCIPKWLRNTKARDFGVPTCVIVLMTIFNGGHWIYTICFGLTFAAQTSYFKKKGTDSKWYNWIMVGLAFSIALIPYAIITGHWYGFLYRLIVVTTFTVAWSLANGKDYLEEYGRGFIQAITVPML